MARKRIFTLYPRTVSSVLVAWRTGVSGPDFASTTRWSPSIGPLCRLSGLYGRTLKWDGAFENQVRHLTAQQVLDAMHRHILRPTDPS